MPEGAIQTDVFGLPETKCRNAASGDSPNTINLGNALGKLKPKISPERAQHFVATKRKRIKLLHPFRARSSQTFTQGVALGYHIAPRWGLV
jgi:hypothetical protein